ncbi:MAG TPA: alpha/beta hydrolase [Nitrososphaeraceae archaeon]|nr:alpha/beta hydrolase [Nitrososphaeraceae archaeon]
MIKSNDFGFNHVFVNSSFTNNSNNKKEYDETNKELTLVLLHGTGGNEEDLIFLGKELEPYASILSPRGKVLENGMPRFFRRLSEGVFDLKDLRFRTQELADFIQNCSLHYKFDLKQTIAVGFSNGANIASSILLLRPDVLQGAVLFRAMIPFIPNDPLPNLSSKKILLSAGIEDPIVSRTETENLYNLFQKINADVTLKWQYSSHNLIGDDLIIAKEWISNKFH